MLAHLLGMSTTKLGLEPLIGVEELAEYLGVPVQTIYDWRLSGRAPRAYKFGKHLRFAVSDITEWLEQRHEDGPHE
jgi:excisionase family DNA binding protein